MKIETSIAQNKQNLQKKDMQEGVIFIVIEPFLTISPILYHCQQYQQYYRIVYDRPQKVNWYKANSNLHQNYEPCLYGLLRLPFMIVCGLQQRTARLTAEVPHFCHAKIVLLNGSTKVFQKTSINSNVLTNTKTQTSEEVS